MTQTINPYPTTTIVPQQTFTPLPSTPYIPTTSAPAFPAIPPKVAAAISQVMGGVKALERTEKNVHGAYKFASIDDFLELVRPLCAAAGLIIVQDEVSTDMIDAGVNRDGKPRRWLRIVHGFTLAHSSGETWQHRPQRTSMVDATMGSQGYGAAQSYTLKLFLRSLFQVATGEGVADDVDRQPVNPLPMKEDERMAYIQSCYRLINTSTDVEKLRTWWKNDVPLRQQYDLSSQEVQDLIAAINRHKEHLERLAPDPPPPPAAEDYEHPGDLCQRIVDNLDGMNVEDEIRDYMTDNEVWKKMNERVFSKPQMDVIEKAFRQAIERATTPPAKGAAPPNPFA